MMNSKVMLPDGSRIWVVFDAGSPSWLDQALKVSKVLDGWFMRFEGDTKLDECYIVDGSLMFGSVGQCQAGKTIDDGSYSGAFVDWKPMMKEEIMRLWKIRAFK